MGNVQIIAYFFGVGIDKVAVTIRHFNSTMPLRKGSLEEFCGTDCEL